ncbi:hypothetical protein N9B69_02345, partial [Amylibacter sp.]|nr:hypothetical protein [Amylibacter sp.]
MKIDKNSLEYRTSSLFAFVFTLVILIYAASGPLGEFVRWFIESTTDGFDELSRRDKRDLYKTHWLGANYRWFERSVLLPTGMILGLPILLSFAVTMLALPMKYRLLPWVLTAISTAIFLFWIAILFAV